jgi:hypothetical protein
MVFYVTTDKSYTYTPKTELCVWCGLPRRRFNDSGQRSSPPPRSSSNLLDLREAVLVLVSAPASAKPAQARYMSCVNAPRASRSPVTRGVKCE